MEQGKTSMTGTEAGEPNSESDRQADAMKDQLRKDVALWSAARADTSDNGPRSAVPVTTQASSPPVARAQRQKAKPVEVVKPVETVKQPFKMSYDGTTDRDYIAHRI